MILYMNESKIDFELNGKQLMYDGSKYLKIILVDTLSKQVNTKDYVSLLAPNGIDIKGICKYNDKPYDIRLRNEVHISKRSNEVVKLEGRYGSDLQLLSSLDNKGKAIATIQPFTIQLDLTKDFKLYRVTNIHQISKSKIYAPNGFEVWLNGYNISNSCKALEYYYEYTKGYSWQKGNYVLQYNDMYDFDSNEEHNRTTKRLGATDKVELRFYQD
jgi:hypothetical protein